MYKYELDPTKSVGATEQTRDARWMDRWMDGVKPIYPQTTSLCGGYNNIDHSFPLTEGTLYLTFKVEQWDVTIIFLHIEHHKFHVLVLL